MGAAYERAQRFEEAERQLKKSLALSPDFSEAMNYLGYMWADRGVNLPEAHKLIEKAVQAEPKNAAYLDSLGWVLFKLERPKEALPWLLKAIDNSDEPDATLYDHLGDVYSALHESAKAQEAWKKSVELEPKEEVKKKLGAATGPDASGATP
jgi:tetratricopeptide (TPR) repeat protein